MSDPSDERRWHQRAGTDRPYRELSTLCTTVISAPSADQSGASHAILNTRGGVSVRRVDLGGGVIGHAVAGSPAEAAVVGLYALVPGSKFDLVVSGVNRGENLGLGNLYSGTVNAAMEGALRGVPSLAVSQAKAYGTDYRRSAVLTRRIAEKMLARKPSSDVVLNVNIPHGPIRGLKVLPSGKLSTVFDGFDASPGADGVTIYTPKISPRNDARESGDVREYQAGYITVVPLALDRTADASIPGIRKWMPDVSSLPPSE